MKQVMTLLVLITLLHPAIAQTSSQDKKVRELLELTGAGKMGVQMAQQMMTEFQKSFKTVPSTFWEKMMGEFHASDLIDMVVPIYGKYYSADEIDQLITFYQTPLGKKVISVTPKIMQESMQLGQTWGKKIAEKIIKELTEEGYKPESA